jgi:Trm5-related predicted tRNA methylase
MIFRYRHRLWCYWSSSIQHFHILHCQEHIFNLQRQLRQAKLLVAARLSDYIVIDCSFANENSEDDSPLGNYYERLQLKIHSCFTPLYRYHSPSFVILCNVFSNDNDKWLRKSPFCHATTHSYLDLFPREQLIYLSPDSPNIMTEYQHDMIYILGGIFQKSKLYLQEC